MRVNQIRAHARTAGNVLQPSNEALREAERQFLLSDHEKVIWHREYQAASSKQFYKKLEEGKSKEWRYLAIN